MSLFLFLKHVVLLLIVQSSIFIFKPNLLADQLITERHQACTNPPKFQSPWHVCNVYDYESNSLFIPYQLWSGADFNGDKSSHCMHKVKHTFVVNNDGEKVTISGPQDWFNPATSNVETVWLRQSQISNKVQRFSCHTRGIGRVYDSRRERYFRPGRCKFPAGYGWRLNKSVVCDNTKVELTQVNWSQNHELESIVFKWWFRKKSGQWHLDYIYRYATHTGMTHAWKQ